MKLFCGADPKELRIEDNVGNFDMELFKQHVKGCDVCRCSFDKILNGLYSKKVSARLIKRLEVEEEEDAELLQ